MKKIELFALILILLSSIFIGCVGTPESTPTPTPIITTEPTITVTSTPTPTLAPTPVPTPVRIPRFYKTDVDQWYGFPTVREINNTPFVYENHTLNIYSGDNVMWINDADPDETLTVVSEQGLWDNVTGKLRWNYQEINYTFIEPGTYGVYIREYPRLIHQKIVVSP